MTEVRTVSLDKESQNVGPQTLGQLQSYRFLLLFCCFWAAIPETLRMLKVCWYFLPGHHASVWLGSRLTEQAILPTVNGHCVFCRLQWRNMQLERPELRDFTGSQTLTQQPATANNSIYTMINYHTYWPDIMYNMILCIHFLFILRICLGGSDSIQSYIHKTRALLIERYNSDYIEL